MAAAVVEANRLRFALARHPGDAGGRAAAKAAGLRSGRRQPAAGRRLRRRRGLRRQRAAAAAAPGACGRRGRRAAALHAWDRRARQHRARRDHHEIVIGDGVFEFLAEKPLVDEGIHVRRVGVGEFALIKANRMGVLQPAENELFLLFALRRLPPDGHGHRHHDGHDAHGDNQRRHGVAGVGLTSIDLTR